MIPSILIPALVAAAHAQCTPEWLPGDPIPGISGPFTASTVWDPDGPGPAPDRLIVGGEFDAAGGVAASRIAAWDGASWSSLGAGMNGYVLAVRQRGSDLIAAGGFTLAGGSPANAVARWDGAAWHPLGSGVTGVFDAAVRALTEYEGDLIAGGEFAQAGGTAANCIARWDGAAWHPLGAGIAPVVPGFWAPVLALVVHQGDLIAGGFFNEAGGQAAESIARWDGASWHPLGTGISGIVHALAGYDGDLYVGGEFNAAGGQYARHVARWDGAS